MFNNYLINYLVFIYNLIIFLLCLKNILSLHFIVKP